MKRIQAACIMQALTFSQKDENGFGRDEALRLNHAEFEHYKETLKRTRTHHKIDCVEEFTTGTKQCHTFTYADLLTGRVSVSARE